MIKKLRESFGWTQGELADKLKTSQKVISDYENLRRKPPIDRIPLIAKTFNITTDELLEVKKVKIKQQGKRVHKNSRSVKMQELFDKLSPEDQKAILKQVKALVG